MGTRGKPAVSSSNTQSLLDAAKVVKDRVYRQINSELDRDYESEVIYKLTPASVCGIASQELSQELERQGIEHDMMIGFFKVDLRYPLINGAYYPFPGQSREAMNDDILMNGDTMRPGEYIRDMHIWVEIGDKVLDISADQFNPYIDEKMPDVYYGPRTWRYEV